METHGTAVPWPQMQWKHEAKAVPHRPPPGPGCSAGQRPVGIGTPHLTQTLQGGPSRWPFKVALQGGVQICFCFADDDDEDEEDEDDEGDKTRTRGTRATRATTRMRTMRMMREGGRDCPQRKDLLGGELLQVHLHRVIRVSPAAVRLLSTMAAAVRHRNAHHAHGFPTRTVGCSCTEL